MRVFIQIIYVVFQITHALSVLHPDGYEYEECPPEHKKCEFWLVVQEHLTMIYEKNLVYAHKGNLYLYNEHHSNFTTHVSLARKGGYRAQYNDKRFYFFIRYFSHYITLHRNASAA